MQLCTQTVQYPFWVLYSTDTIVWVRCTQDNCPGMQLHVASPQTVPTRLVWSVCLTNLAGSILDPGRLLSSRPPRYSILHTAFSPMINVICLEGCRGIRH